MPNQKQDQFNQQEAKRNKFIMIWTSLIEIIWTKFHCLIIYNIFYTIFE